MPLTEADAQFILQLLNTDGWKRYIGDRGVTDEASAIAYLQRSPMRLEREQGMSFYQVCKKDDGTPIGAAPRYLLVGPELETIAERLLASIYAATVDDVNPFSQKLSLLVEPRLPGDEWYVFADPANVPFFEHAYLSGAEGPQISTREGWETLHREYRVTLDFGAAIVDYRGAVKSEGTA